MGQKQMFAFAHFLLECEVRVSFYVYSFVTYAAERFNFVLLSHKLWGPLSPLCLFNVSSLSHKLCGLLSLSLFHFHFHNFPPLCLFNVSSLSHKLCTVPLPEQASDLAFSFEMQFGCTAGTVLNVIQINVKSFPTFRPQDKCFEKRIQIYFYFAVTKCIKGMSSWKTLGSLGNYP